MNPLPPSRALVVWRKFYIKPRKPPKLTRTVCEVLREIYRDAEQRGDTLTMHRCDEAHDMAKRMDRKLKEYWRRFNWERVASDGGRIERRE